MDMVPNTMQASHQGVSPPMGGTPVDQPMNDLRLSNNNALVSSCSYPIPQALAGAPTTVGWPYHNQLAPGWFANQEGQVFGFGTTSDVEQNTTFIDCSPINGLAPINGLPTLGAPMLCEPSPTLQSSYPYPIPGNMAMHDVAMASGCPSF